MSELHDLARHGQAPAIHHDSTGWIAYEALAAMADESVAGLRERTLFALEFMATPQCVAAYLGALRHGHVPLLVDAQLDAAMRESLYDHFGIRRVFGGTGWRERAGTAASEPALHDTLGLLMSTSGSTGSPKLVRLSVGNLEANARSIVAFMDLTAAARAITSLPLHYSYGLSVLNSHLMAGAGIVLSDEAVTTAPFWERFRAHEVTGLGGVPTTWRMLRRMRFERMALPSLRLMTQAGGRLDVDDVRWLEGVAKAADRRLYIMYGQTEATARIAYLPPHWLATKAGSIGVAIPGGTLEVVDAEGRQVAAGDEGELAYRGPNVMMGYAEFPEDLATAGTIDQLRTGDLGHRDADGLHWITGRIKRFVKVFGNRFSLDDVEAHVRGRGFDAGVVGRDDLLMVAACAPEDALDTLRAELAAYYRLHPSAIRVARVQALPRNSAGKLLHAALLAQLDNQDGGSKP